MHHQHRRLRIMFADQCLLVRWPRWSRSDPPHPAFASFSAYDPIFHIEGSYFGKEFLRMAGIVQMLHFRKPPYDKYPYANRIRVRSL